MSSTTFQFLYRHFSPIFPGWFIFQLANAAVRIRNFLSNVLSYFFSSLVRTPSSRKKYVNVSCICFCSFIGQKRVKSRSFVYIWTQVLILKEAFDAKMVSEYIFVLRQESLNIFPFVFNHLSRTGCIIVLIPAV